MIILLSLLSPAHACGGMFCDTTTGERVDQAGERIIFAIDPVDNCVEMHVEITYEGRAEEFAWLIPVPAEPEIGVSTPALFDLLDNGTAPVFTMLNITDGNCGGAGCGGGGKDDTDSDASEEGIDDFIEDDIPPTVQIADQRRVGAYETVTLRGTSGAAVIDWLQTNDYDLPTDLDDNLNPYLDEGSWFVALRLAQNANGGVLDPLSLKFTDTQTPTIPLRLTAIAATDDMPITVWLLGPEHYAPTNAAVVSLNTARLGWWSNFDNYTALLSEAVDEAGGEAWLTESVDVLSNFGDSLYRGLPVDAVYTELSQEETPADFVTRALGIWNAATESADPTVVNDALAGCIDSDPLPVSAQEFWEDPSAHESVWPELGFDPLLCADLVVERAFEPRRHAKIMLASTESTRLTTTISPAEMQTDPQFGATASPLSDRLTDASTMKTWCAGVDDPLDGRRTWEVADYEVPMPSARWLTEEGITAGEWVAQTDMPAAALVERMTEDGQLEPVVDNRDAIAKSLGALRREGPAGQPCGCVGGQSKGPPLVLLFALWVRRRTGR